MAYYGPQRRSFPNSPIPAAVQKITERPTEDFTRGTGNHPAQGVQAPTPRALGLDWVGVKVVPRLWKPGVSGWASPSSPGWPSTASMGLNAVTTPHIRIRTLARNTPQAMGTGAVLRPASGGRIAPALVPRARVAR